MRGSSIGRETSALLIRHETATRARVYRAPGRFLSFRYNFGRINLYPIMIASKIPRIQI